MHRVFPVAVREALDEVKFRWRAEQFVLVKYVEVVAPSKLPEPRYRWRKLFLDSLSRCRICEQYIEAPRSVPQNHKA
jgi:hypothetical protein